jgi:hypothetical protein
MAETPRVEYRKGQGPDQLEQGEAQALNDAPMPGPPADALEEAPAEADVPVQLATPADREAAYTPVGEDEELLFQPSTRPDEPVLGGLGADRTISPRLASLLPYLVQIAAQEDAPPQLRIFVDQALRQQRRA